MPRNEIGETINSLPIEHMVAAPIIAAIKAQKEASAMLADFLNTVALDKNGKARMLTFEYSQETADTSDGSKSQYQKRYIQAPFVALSGIPNIAVETVQVDFELEVNTSDESKSTTESNSKVEGESRFFFTPKINFSASLSHKSEQTRKTDTRAKYSFHVEARKQEQPEALMRIIDVITNASAVATDKEPEVKNLIDDKNSGQDKQ